MKWQALRWRQLHLIKSTERRKFMVRRDGRVAEGARLESVYTLTGIGGSNPSLSARSSLSQTQQQSLADTTENLRGDPKFDRLQAGAT